MGAPRLGNPRGLPPAVRRRVIPSIPTPPTISRVAVTREYPPDRLAVRIDAPNGYSNRWAEDEHLAQNVLSNIELEDEMPGGDKSLSGVLARDPRFNWQEMEAYAEMRCYNPLMDVFEGFMDKAPDVSGDQMSITPAALGYQAILEDDRGEAIGFIDRDLQKWGGPSSGRIIQFAGTISADGVNIINGWQSAAQPNAGIIYQYDHLGKGAVGGEMWYYGEGAPIHDFVYDYYGTGLDAAWVDIPYLSNDDKASSIDGGPNYQGNVGPFLGNGVHASNEAKKYALLQTWRNQGESEINPYGGRHMWLNPTMLGPIQATSPAKGTWPNIGYSMKQMIEWMIPHKAAPLEARPGDIDDDGFLITQAWYGGRGPLSDIVHDVTKYSLYDWFVRKGKRLRVKEPGSYGNYWKTYMRESELSEVGIDSQALWNEIVVSFTDVSGRTIFVGPPGSGCDVESPLLKVTDPEHPANRAGRTRRDLLDMKGISNPAQAIEVGIRFLEEAALLNHAGSATLTGYVLDHNGVIWPAACVKSGDWISFMDAADNSYRKIVNRKYSHNTRGSEIEIDAPPSGMEQLLERLQSELISLGVS
jgi:hypothetical protein